jgi:hypothetical protein
MGLLYGRAGRLNTKNAGFRPGQSFGAPATLPAPKPAGTGDDGAVAPTDGGSGQAYGWASNVGGRKENQDKVFAAVLRPRGQSVWIGGVFDGHGKEGKAAAEYCRDRVQQILEERVDELLVPDDARVAAVVTVESEALFLFFTSNILLLCGGLYGELYERLYNKVLSARRGAGGLRGGARRLRHVRRLFLQRHHRHSLRAATGRGRRPPAADGVGRRLARAGRGRAVGRPPDCRPPPRGGRRARVGPGRGEGGTGGSCLDPLRLFLRTSTPFVCGVF